jgi:hypothetical protein
MIERSNMENEKDIILREFLNRWSLGKVKAMTISEYNQLGNNDTFCYWVEHKTKKIANISGSSTSFKFEIFEREDKNKIYRTTDFKKDELYSWRKRAGNTREEAFNKTKANIIRVIKSSLKGNFKEIDNREIELSPLFRWKIAFLYSNKKILAISDRIAVKWLAKQYGMFNYTNARLSSVHAFLMTQINKSNFWEEDELMWNLYKKFKTKGQSLTISSTKTKIRKETDKKNTQEYIRTIHIHKEILLTKEHNKIQNSLFKKLISLYKKECVKMEKNFIDIRVEHDDKIEYYEVKCDYSATRCIRMALGQVIEYAFNDSSTKKKEIIVFGNHKPKKEEIKYISHIKDLLPDLKFSYLYNIDQI